ncbi:Type I restriction-modification system, specificity subunit S [Gilliamella apicola]|nr:restriction endonuclease subunit S [Gilliamella apicola]KFA58409.1 Type I restriction-modification system, specificity subunit S [Gilliamella apicola]
MSESKKLIPRRRFKQFSGNWNITTLGKIAEIVRGASPRPIQDQKWFDKNSDIGWLRISDVTEQEGRIYYLEQRLSLAGQEKTRVLYEPHLLLSIAATVGKPVINYIKTGVHDGFLIFLNPKFHQEFLFQYLDMFKLQWKKYGQPGSQVNLNSDIVKNHNIELPNSDEQTQIGEFFKKLDNLINTQQKKLEKAKTLKSAYLTEMFPNEGELKPKRRFLSFKYNWKEFKIKELFTITRGKVLASNQVSMNRTYLYPYPVYSSQTKNNGLMGYYKEFLFENAITWTTDGANAGTVNYRENKFYSTNVNGVLLSSDGFANKAIAEMLDTIAWKYVSKVGNPKLMNVVMAEILILIPNIEEQTKIGNFFKLLDNKIALEQKKLDKLKNIKQAYLNEMFV